MERPARRRPTNAGRRGRDGDAIRLPDPPDLRADQEPDGAGPRWPVAEDLGPGRPAPSSAPRPMPPSEARSRPMPDGRSKGPRVVDTFAGLVSATGARAEGRLYEIPMDARSILADPDRALELMEQAVEDAIGWGARIVGLGSMTGIIGNHGEFLAERHPIAVTTGNSLTVYATLRNLEHYCEALGIDLADEEVAVVGIPGSIATAVAALLAPRCRRLVLGGEAGFTPGDPAGRPAGCTAGGGPTQGPGRGLDRGDGHVVGRLHRPELAPPGLPGARRRRAQRRPPGHAGPRRCPDPLRRLCARARGDAPRLVLPAVLSRDRAFLPGRDDGPGAGGPRRLVLDRARPRPRPRPRDRPAGRGARLRLLGGAGVRPAAESGGPISVPQGALEDPPGARSRPMPLPAADGRGRSRAGRRRSRSTSPTWPSTRPSGMRGTSIRS